MDPAAQASSPATENFVEEASLAPTGFTKSDSLVLVAQSLIGAPYRYAGKDPQGFDCSGFTRYAFRKVGISLAAFSQAQFRQGGTVSVDDAQLGDLVFFRGVAK